MHSLDVDSAEAIATLADALRGTAIDMLVNNAGVLGHTIDSRGPGAFGSLDYTAWERVHAINTVAPLRMAEAFVDHVAASEMKLMFFMSTHMGSIADLADGGFLPLPVEQGGAETCSSRRSRSTCAARRAHHRGPSRLGEHGHGRRYGHR